LQQPHRPFILTNTTQDSIVNQQFIQEIGRYVNKASRKGVPQNDAGWRQKKEGTPSFFL